MITSVKILVNPASDLCCELLLRSANSNMFLFRNMFSVLLSNT